MDKQDEFWNVPDNKNELDRILDELFSNIGDQINDTNEKLVRNLDYERELQEEILDNNILS